VAREPTRFEQRRLRCRQSTPDASRRTRYHRSHRGHARIGLPGLSSATASGAEPWRNCGVVRARRDHGGTQLAAGPARLRGLSRWGCRRHVAARSRRGEIAWSIGQAWRVSAHTQGARPHADLMSGQGNRGRGRGRPSRLRVASRPQTLPGRPYHRGVRWVSTMRLRLGRARLLGGLVGAWQPGQGGDGS
jgi:hypothetical protein